jgi:hypothetical protein
MVQPAMIEAKRVATGLSQPLFATAPSTDPTRLFVVEKTGQIEVLNLGTNTLTPAPFLDLSGQVATDGEQGLLGLSFHADYAANGRFFVYLAALAGGTEVREYHASANPNLADPASGRLLLHIDQPGSLTNHKGGWIGFGPDGDLYIATGDGGGAGDPFGNAQNTNSLLGKLLRIDVNGPDAFPADPAHNYAIPTGNPFAAGGGAPEVWAWGLRNPWRASFDHITGQMWIGDVGQGRFEEIDLGAAGANYGWNLFEGAAPFTLGASTAGLTPPLYSYGRDMGTTVIGGYVDRGPENELQGAYLFSDAGSGHVYSLVRGAAAAPVVTDLTTTIRFDAGGPLHSPVSFGEDAQRRLYVVDLGGDVFRLTPRGVSDDPLFDAGFYLTANPDVLAAGVDPLAHFRQSGWHEGRSPDLVFDTSGYLAAYPDVAAAGVDPLEHYLHHGIQESRQAFADGNWT